MEFVERRIDDGDRASFDFDGLTCPRLLGRILDKDVELFSWIVNSDRSAALIPLAGGFPEDWLVFWYKFVISNKRIDVVVRKTIKKLPQENGNLPASEEFLINWELVEFDFSSSVEGERERLIEVLKRALSAESPFGVLLNKGRKFRAAFDF